MRRLFAAALAASLVFAVVPTTAQAATNPTTTEAQLLLKKKKLAAQLKLLQAQQVELDKSLAAQKKPVVKKISIKKTDAVLTASVSIIKVKKAKPIPVAAAPTRVAHLRPCGSFVQCLFGSKHRRERQTLRPVSRLRRERHAPRHDQHYHGRVQEKVRQARG